MASSRAALFRPKGPQPILKALESLRLDGHEMIGERRRLLHQERCVGAHPGTIASAEQAPDRLAGRLPEQIPQRDIDATDGVRNRAAASLPERVLVKFFAHSLGFQGGFPAVERLEHLQRSSHQRVVGKDAAQPGQTRIGVNRDQRVDAVVRPELGAPSAFRRGASQPGAPDLSDLHGRIFREKLTSSTPPRTERAAGTPGRGV